MAALHIIAACSNRKRAVPAGKHRLGAHCKSHGLVRRWLDVLADGSGESMCVRDLYVGNHWAAVRDLPARARDAGWRKASLWVASAGVGLAHEDEEIVPYSATFGARDADSVIDGSLGEAPLIQRARWWDKVNAARSLRSGGGIAEQVAANPNAAWLVVASKPYVEAMSQDVTRALEHMRAPGRFVILSSGEFPSDTLGDHVISVGADLLHHVGGPLTALHGRLARHLVSQVEPRSWSVSHVRRLVAEMQATSEARSVPKRDVMTDHEVRAFIRRHLRRIPTTSASALLRELRASGRACEQKRFRDLFHETRQSHAAE